MDGIILINKEKGYTSQDVVSCVKKILNEKKAGHTGTLDPMATGVLPILIGNATKLSKYLIEHDKEYIATIKFGLKTDTGDLEGKIVEEKNIENLYLEEENIKNILKLFLGEIFQTPPMYSAIKVNGKKLYEYAREGKEVKRDKRKIEIYKIQLLEINNKEKEIKIKTMCSKGTYIRTLCEDIAIKLGTIGCMKNLERTKVDRFKLENSVTLEELKNNINIISIEDYYTNYKFIDQIDLNETKLKLFENGTIFNVNIKDGLYRVYNNKKFIGLGIINNKKLKRDIVI